MFAHPAVGWFELYCIIVLIPSLFLSPLSIITVTLCLFSVRQLQNCNKKIALLLLLGATIPFAPAAWLFNTSTNDLPNWPFVTFLVFSATLLAFGFYAVKKQFSGSVKDDL
ncbi:hypothetical protein BM524_10105 [Alteromonas mediterranea]|uniref:Uncharacterized protein n=1 Tax=Alteromonas mediterranea TaxID=314275 RepID=A0AAC9JAH3_9ALTE|nr:hypothetical protein [Alteromonas mediterranea]APD90114.1 hypothetical protein BM524_10105 [Alteromonas mediterranea]